MREFEMISKEIDIIFGLFKKLIIYFFWRYLVGQRLINFERQKQQAAANNH